VFFTGEGFLRHIGQLRDLSGSQLNERIANRLSQFGLSDCKTVLVSRYSKGMMARLGLAQAVLHDPRLLILDSPRTDSTQADGKRYGHFSRNSGAKEGASCCVRMVCRT